MKKKLKCRDLKCIYAYILKVPIGRKGAYWIKMCLLTEKMSIEWKYAYWLKMCILNENVPIEGS